MDGVREDPGHEPLTLAHRARHLGDRRLDVGWNRRGSSRRENVMSQFAGKVVLVTGGNAGIGRAAAIAFARQGAQVVVSGRREKEGNAVIAEIEASGGEAIFVKTDVSKEREVESMIGRTLARFGR